jgi:hypothetical protein
MPETCSFFDKIKFGKFVRLVGFIKKKFYDARSHERETELLPLAYSFLTVTLHVVTTCFTTNFAKRTIISIPNLYYLRVLAYIYNTVLITAEGKIQKQFQFLLTVKSAKALGVGNTTGKMWVCPLPSYGLQHWAEELQHNCSTFSSHVSGVCLLLVEHSNAQNTITES